MIPENGNVSSMEVVANRNPPISSSKTLFSSGGGFSLYQRAPAYQQEALDTYFNDHAPPYPSFYVAASNGDDSTTDSTDIVTGGGNYIDASVNTTIGAGRGRYNRAGRGYPDVSANGVNILNIDNGCAVQQFGTSASAPIVASMIALVNNERLNAGKRCVGFVNPVLYANPQIFRDVVEGHNEGCGTDGFEAVEGWDPVTGLGTINFPKMLEVFMGLP